MIVIEPKAESAPPPAVATVRVAEVLPAFNYDGLSPAHARLAREAVAFIDSRQRKMAADALEIGGKLNEVKAALEHGQFAAWLASSFSMTARTAQNYMQAATVLGAKYETVSHLPVSTVYEIARAPEPIREKVIEELEAAPAPLSAKAVSEAIWTEQQKVKQAEREAKQTPAYKKAEKAKDARWRKRQDERDRAFWRERGKQHARDEKALVELVELLRSRLAPEEIAGVVELMHHCGSIGSVPYRLGGAVYGHVADEHGHNRRPRSKEEWEAWLAACNAGENMTRHPLRDWTS